MSGPIFNYIPVVYPASTMTFGVMVPSAVMQPCISAVYVPPLNTVTAISAPPTARIPAVPFSVPKYLIKARLNALPAGKDAPLLIRIMTPMLQDIIEDRNSRDDEIAGALDMLIKELETVAEGKKASSDRFFTALEELQTAATEGDRINDLLAEDIGLLWADLVYSGKELVGRFVNDLMTTVEKGLNEREIALRLGILKQFLHSEDTGVVIEGLLGIAALADDSSIGDHLQEFAGPGIIPLIEEHLKTPSSIRIRSATELLDALWPQLGADEKIAAIETIYGIFSQYENGYRIGAYGTIAILDFLARHESDIPENLLNNLKEDAKYAEMLFSELPSGSDKSFPSRQRNIPAYIRWIEGGKAEEHLQERARAVVERYGGIENYEVRYKYFCALCFFYIYGADTSKKEETLKRISDLLADYEERFSVSFQFLLPHLTPGGHRLIYEYAKKKFEEEVRRGEKWPQLHSVIFDRFTGVNEWQDPEALHFFDVLQEIHGVDISRLTQLSKSIPRAYLPVLRETLEYLFTAKNPVVRPLILHLLKTAGTPEQLREAVTFFRDFNNLDRFDQEEFYNSVSADSQKEVQVRMDPENAPAGLRDFLVETFVNYIARSAEEKTRILEDIRARIELWGEGNLLTHLESLSGFSYPPGIEAIRTLVHSLLSSRSVEATAAAGNRRFFNPSRYDSMEGVFSPVFIRKWSNNDEDRVIPIGSLDAYENLSQDPAAVRRVNYEYTARQIALHMGIEGAINFEEQELYGALKDHVEGLKITKIKGGMEWISQMTNLISQMQSAEEIEQWEVTEVIDFLKRNLNVVGWGTDEVVFDLKELRRNLSAGALTGRAWLIITSNPAEMIASGGMPATCQNPMKDSSFNHNGEPVSRANEGRFLYAKIVIASDVHLENGTAVMSKDGEMVARSHLEVTTESGLPDPLARPHLLVEREYVYPGFIYKDEFAAALNRFAEEELGLDAAREVHIQFTDQNMDNFPPHLADIMPINRVTFR